jgi:hypothetical protein
MFDITRDPLLANNGLWICGYSNTGALVHTQAVRRYDCTTHSLHTHLRDHRHAYITPGSTPDPDQTFYVGPRILHQLTGTLCYHGDFWLQSRGLQSQRLIALLSRLMIETMVTAWDPDAVFALVPRKLAEKGLGLWYGYPHCVPGQWVLHDTQITDEDHFIWMDREDMLELSHRPLPGIDPLRC